MSQTPTSTTNFVLKTAENIVENVTKLEVVEILEVGGKTTENIVKILVNAGGKPVAIILAIAVLITTLTLPIVVVNFILIKSIYLRKVP
ncbi:MAG: hypothetical protein F6K62_06830 [Sphaerospermopsis sp. SIO1G2]|nr:hypothetical protein [Sphaerospermopsis sp. SIO1G2]